MSIKQCTNCSQSSFVEVLIPSLPSSVKSVERCLNCRILLINVFSLEAFPTILEVNNILRFYEK